MNKPDRHSALAGNAWPASTEPDICAAWETQARFSALAVCRNCGRRHTVRLSCSGYAAGRPVTPPVMPDLSAVAATFQSIRAALIPVFQAIAPAIRQAFDMFQSIHDGGPEQFHRELKLATPCPWCKSKEGGDSNCSRLTRA